MFRFFNNKETDTRRIVTVFVALMFFGPFYYAFTSADDGRETLLKAKALCAKRLNSGNDYEKVLAEDGTLIVCGQGEKAPWSEKPIISRRIIRRSANYAARTPAKHEHPLSTNTREHRQNEKQKNRHQPSVL